MRLRAAGCLAVAFLLLVACSDDDDGATVPTVTTGASTTTTAVPGASTAPPAEDLLGGFQPAAIEFTDCGDGTECGRLAVPLDWSDPSGPTIELAVARVPAAHPDERIGVLATNPGGPGADGISFISGGGYFAGTELGDRFDIVSWDPRGVGSSVPLTCDEGVNEGFLRLDSDPDDEAEQAALDDAAEAYAASCQAEHGDLLPHVGTDDVAYDLEAIRRSLSQPLAYVGFSYGTFIGLRYAELFPQGAASIVLDGVVDPEFDLADLLRSQATAFDPLIEEALGDRADTWDELAAQVEDEPIPTDDGRGLGPADLATGTFYAGYDPAHWEELRDGVDDAADGDGSALLAMADSYRDAIEYAPYQAVECIDSVHPVGAGGWAELAQELEGISPRLGAAIANEMLPCAFWPVPAQPVDGPVRAALAPPILVIGTTGDPVTPVESAERVAAGLADGHLLLYDGEGHAGFPRSSCVEEAVTRYLVDGTLPADGARCD